MLKVLAILFFLASFACVITATTGSTRVGGFTVGRTGQVRDVTPVRTITLSRGERRLYYVLSFAFLASSVFCLVWDKRTGGDAG